LLVEDNDAVALALQELLASRGRFHLVRIDRLDAVLAAVAESRFDIILLDLSLPDSTGLETVGKAHEIVPGIPIMVLTSTDDDLVGAGAVRRGAEDYLVKERVDERTVFRAASHAIERHRLQRQRDQLVEELSASLERIRVLSGLLSICSYCKRIRNNEGGWNQLEIYLRDHSDAEFSHGICPQCASEVLKEIEAYEG